MAHISINKESCEQKFSNNLTINEIADSILDKQKKREGVITEVILDGESIEFEGKNPLLLKNGHDFETIDFSFKTSLELAYEALDSCVDYIDVLIKKVKLLSEYYQANNFIQANNVFAEVIEVLDLYIQLISKIHKTIKRHRPDCLEGTEIVQKLEIHLLSVLKAMLPAKEREDIIMLSDLLEYELVDNLTQWKIQAIPALKRLQNI